MKHDIAKLPKWAQVYISDLKERIDRAEKTIPWTEPGMEWFTLFSPISGHRRAPQRLFTCTDNGTRCVCTLGENDCVFVGRGTEASHEQ